MLESCSLVLGIGRNLIRKGEVSLDSCYDLDYSRWILFVLYISRESFSF